MEFLELFDIVHGNSFWMLVRICEVDEENLCREVFALLFVGVGVHNNAGVDANTVKTIWNDL